MNAQDVLKAARARLCDADHWAKGRYCTDKDGHAVSAYDPTVCKWCLLGSTMGLGDPNAEGEARLVLNEAVRITHPKSVSVAAYNDYYATFDDIVKVFDLAEKIAVERGL